jgi:hypothetical protein
LGTLILPPSASTSFATASTSSNGGSALKADRAIFVFGPLVHCAVDAGVGLVACGYHEEIGRPPLREAPSENLAFLPTFLAKKKVNRYRRFESPFLRHGVCDSPDPLGGPIQTSIVLGPDGTIFAGAFDRNLYAINPDGSLKWTFNSVNPLTQEIGSDCLKHIPTNFQSQTSREIEILVLQRWEAGIRSELRRRLFASSAATGRKSFYPFAPGVGVPASWGTSFPPRSGGDGAKRKSATRASPFVSSPPNAPSSLRRAFSFLPR